MKSRKNRKRTRENDDFDYSPQSESSKKDNTSDQNEIDKKDKKRGANAGKEYAHSVAIRLLKAGIVLTFENTRLDLINKNFPSEVYKISYEKSYNRNMEKILNGEIKPRDKNNKKQKIESNQFINDNALPNENGFDSETESEDMDESTNNRKTDHSESLTTITITTNPNNNNLWFSQNIHCLFFPTQVDLNDAHEGVEAGKNIAYEIIKIQESNNPLTKDEMLDKLNFGVIGKNKIFINNYIKTANRILRLQIQESEEVKINSSLPNFNTKA